MQSLKHYSPLLLLSLILSSCSAQLSGGQAAFSTDTIKGVATIEAATPQLPTETVTAETIEPENQSLFDAVLCEESYCIYDAPALLESPLPADMNQIADVTYRYGTTQMGQREAHLGMDVSNPGGTPVLAAAEGIVVVAGNDDVTHYHPYEKFYGNLVIIRHELPGLEQPLYTLYAHLSAVTVEVGESVKKGDQVGLVGATGAAIGSHLHFEVRLGSMDYNSTSNPEIWLKPVINGSNLQTGILAVKVNNPNNIPIDSLLIIARPVGASPEKSRAANYGETYAKGIPSTDPIHEIALFGAIAPAEYEIIFEKYGKFYRTNARVESGKFTLASIDM
jgi:murein DD-endopeptidase MepM/ murein hydrolase activator NlpD